MSVELPTGLWLRTKDVLGQLNLSKATLHRRKSDGYFQRGTHYVTTGPTARANILWNVEGLHIGKLQREGKANENL